METTAITTTGTPPVTKKSSNAELGKDQFLKLFVAQLQHQDPMNPMEDSDFMGQMASFSTLEQVTNMADANAAMAANLQLSQTVGLIGRTVTWTDADDVSHTGVVEKVTHKDGFPVLTVSGTEGVDPTAISEIA
jgi:flagellar basal-body rod modification protein FlgD